MSELSILVPVLRRPQNIVPFVDSIRAATDCDYKIVFIATIDDNEEINAIDDIVGDDIDLLLVEPHLRGDYARKINHGYQWTDSPWLFLGADDIVAHSGWVEHAMTCARISGMHVIGTQDLGNSRVLNGTHSTHTFVHRTYVDKLGTIDERGKVLHEGYPHEFVDDEFIETAKRRDEFVFCDLSVVEHLHPLWGKGPTDALYDAHPDRMRIGRRIYTKRKRLWTSR